jgi:hypothetical protein
MNQPKYLTFCQNIIELLDTPEKQTDYYPSTCSNERRKNNKKEKFIIGITVAIIVAITSYLFYEDYLSYILYKKIQKKYSKLERSSHPFDFLLILQGWKYVSDYIWLKIVSSTIHKTASCIGCLQIVSSYAFQSMNMLVGGIMVLVIVFVDIYVWRTDKYIDKQLNNFVEQVDAFLDIYDVDE